MGAARKFRMVEEDADEGGLLYAADPEGDDALDHAVDAQDLWPAWQCDDCGQRWDGARWTCGYCGTVREDADLCS